MRELVRPIHERPGGPAGLGNIFADDPTPSQLVTVTSGPYLERLPVGNTSVGEIRRRFSDRLDIDPHSQAVLDGRDVGDETIVRPGQALMFARRAGEKGKPVCRS